MQTLAQIIQNTPVLKLTGDPEQAVEGVTHFSPEAAPGYLYVAIKGFKKDGHEFIPDALHRGAKVIVSEKAPALPPGASLVQVPDARKALADIAAAFYGHPSSGMRVIAVTGTNGKTTTTFLLDNIFRAAGFKTGLIGTVCCRVGDRTVPAERTTPESVYLQRYLREMADCGTDYVIMEVSAHALSLDRVRNCEIDVAVCTNVSAEHLDFYNDFQSYLRAKSLLFSGLKPGPAAGKGPRYAVFNRDDPAAAPLMHCCRVPGITFSLYRRGTYQLEKVRLTPSGSECLLRHPRGTLKFDLYLPGTFNCYNTLAAAAVALQEGLPAAAVRAGIERTREVPGRYRRLHTDRGFGVWVDFAHNPAALQNILQTTRAYGRGGLILVIGCQGGTDLEKCRQMGRVAARYADYTIVTSDNLYHDDPYRLAGAIAAGLREAGRGRGDYEVLINRYRAIQRALALAGSGDLVLIAGKGHERYWVVGDTKIPFNDEQVVRRLLAGDVSGDERFLGGVLPEKEQPYLESKRRNMCTGR